MEIDKDYRERGAYLKIVLYGRPSESRPLSEGEARSQTLKWLPGQMFESVVLWDIAVISAEQFGRGPTIAYLRNTALRVTARLPASTLTK